MATPFLSSEEFDERARSHYDAGEYDDALEVLQEGLSLYPASSDLYTGLGYVRLAREEFAWARESFETALSLESEQEDAWAGMGETLLKFGRFHEALGCFDRVAELGFGEDLDLGLSMGRALYREGLFEEARDRFESLSRIHEGMPEVHSALGYTLHVLEDDAGARRELRRALHADPHFSEARLFLSQLLYERGDVRGALREAVRVPPAEHWDPVSLWRVIELKGTLEGVSEGADDLAAWRDRLRELEVEPDPVEQLLAEVEAAFDEGRDEAADPLIRRGREVHTVRTADGALYVGTWEEIVEAMRNSLSDPGEPLDAFMRRAARRVQLLTGTELPADDAEAFIRESERIGLLRIEN
jgi:tetratricopeptide (TPR) repeat protein